MRRSTIRIAPLIVLCVAGAVLSAERGSKPAFRSFCYDDWLCEFIVMNDVHGLGWGRNYLVSDFWLENQHLGFRSFFNYAHLPVREYFMKSFAR